MNIALLGTGLLGRSIAERLQASGHSVVVYNRTREKAEPLQAFGIEIAARPEEAIRRADCVLLVLADAAAIRHVLLSDQATRALTGRTVIQMGTISPSESLALQQEVQAGHGEYLEALVLGSKAEARAGTLLIMVGSTPVQFDHWVILLHCLGQDPRFVGPVGNAATLKLALNQLIAAEIAAFALSLGLVQRAGIPEETFMAILRASALYAPTFDKKLPRLLTRDYMNPNFSVQSMLKDVELIINEATGVGLDARSFEGLRSLFKDTIAEGLGDGDYSALYEAINPQKSTIPQ